MDNASARTRERERERERGERGESQVSVFRAGMIFSFRFVSGGFVPPHARVLKFLPPLARESDALPPCPMPSHSGCCFWLLVSAYLGVELDLLDLSVVLGLVLGLFRGPRPVEERRQVRTPRPHHPWCVLPRQWVSEVQANLAPKKEPAGPYRRYKPRLARKPRPDATSLIRRHGRHLSPARRLPCAPSHSAPGASGFLICLRKKSIWMRNVIHGNLIDFRLFRDQKRKGQRERAHLGSARNRSL